MGIRGLFGVLQRAYPRCFTNVDSDEEAGRVMGGKCIHLAIDLQHALYEGLKYVEMGVLDASDGEVLDQVWRRTLESACEEFGEDLRGERVLLGVARHATRFLRSAAYLSKPQDCVIVAFDGVAPAAKHLQQRQRRWVSGEGESGKSHKSVLDSCAFSPGTREMKVLDVIVGQWLKHILSLHPSLRGSGMEGLRRVVFCPSSSPGEGEHKMMAHLRELLGIGIASTSSTSRISKKLEEAESGGGGGGGGGGESVGVGGEERIGGEVEDTTSLFPTLSNSFLFTPLPTPPPPPPTSSTLPIVLVGADADLVVLGGILHSQLLIHHHPTPSSSPSILLLRRMNSKRHCATILPHVAQGGRRARAVKEEEWGEVSVEVGGIVGVGSEGSSSSSSPSTSPTSTPPPSSLPFSGGVGGRGKKRGLYFTYVSLPTLMSCFAKSTAPHSPSTPNDHLIAHQRTIDLLLLLCFLGCDFLPHIPSMTAQEATLTLLIRALKKAYKEAKRINDQEGEREGREEEVEEVVDRKHPPLPKSLPLTPLFRVWGEKGSGRRRGKKFGVEGVGGERGLEIGTLGGFGVGGWWRGGRVGVGVWGIAEVMEMVAEREREGRGGVLDGVGMMDGVEEDEDDEGEGMGLFGGGEEDKELMEMLKKEGYDAENPLGVSEEGRGGGGGGEEGVEKELEKEYYRRHGACCLEPFLTRQLPSYESVCESDKEVMCLAWWSGFLWMAEYYLTSHPPSWSYFYPFYYSPLPSDLLHYLLSFPTPILSPLFPSSSTPLLPPTPTQHRLAIVSPFSPTYLPIPTPYSPLLFPPTTSLITDSEHAHRESDVILWLPAIPIAKTQSILNPSEKEKETESHEEEGGGGEGEGGGGEKLTSEEVTA